MKKFLIVLLPVILFVSAKKPNSYKGNLQITKSHYHRVSSSDSSSHSSLELDIYINNLDELKGLEVTVGKQKDGRVLARYELKKQNDGYYLINSSSRQKIWNNQTILFCPVDGIVTKPRFRLRYWNHTYQEKNLKIKRP